MTYLSSLDSPQFYCSAAYPTSTGCINFTPRISRRARKVHAALYAEKHGTRYGTGSRKGETIDLLLSDRVLTLPRRSGAQRASRGTSTHYLGRTEARCVRIGSHRQRGGDTVECGCSGAPLQRGGDAAGRGCGWSHMRLLVAAAAGRCLSSPQLRPSLCSLAQGCRERDG